MGLSTGIIGVAKYFFRKNSEAKKVLLNFLQDILPELHQSDWQQIMDLQTNDEGKPLVVLSPRMDAKFDLGSDSNKLTLSPHGKEGFKLAMQDKLVKIKTTNQIFGLEITQTANELLIAIQPSCNYLQLNKIPPKEKNDLHEALRALLIQNSQQAQQEKDERKKLTNPIRQKISRMSRLQKETVNLLLQLKDGIVKCEQVISGVEQCRKTVVGYISDLDQRKMNFETLCESLNCQSAEFLQEFAVKRIAMIADLDKEFYISKKQKEILQEKLRLLDLYNAGLKLYGFLELDKIKEEDLKTDNLVKIKEYRDLFNQKLSDAELEKLEADWKELQVNLEILETDWKKFRFEVETSSCKKDQSTSQANCDQSKI